MFTTASTYISILTPIHVAISLVAIAAGFVAMAGTLTGRKRPGWTAFFLATTVATSLTGFLFPIQQFTPAIGVGLLSLVVLAAALAALYRFHLSGGWKWVYLISALISLYLNVFVAIVQAYQKIPVLRALAPTQSELPFLLTQLSVLCAFVTLGLLSARRLRLANAGSNHFNSTIALRKEL